MDCEAEPRLAPTWNTKAPPEVTYTPPNQSDVDNVLKSHGTHLHPASELDFAITSIFNTLSTLLMVPIAVVRFASVVPDAHRRYMSFPSTHFLPVLTSPVEYEDLITDLASVI